MSNFNVPYTFIGGTKAKAEEVNANFSAVKDELNLKAEKNPDGTIVVGTATANNHAVNKAQAETLIANAISTKADCDFSNLSTEAKNTLQYAPYSVNTGNKDSDGEADLIFVNEDISSNTISFKTGNNEYPALTGMLADGSKFERESISNLDFYGLADGTYNLFIGETGNCVALPNKIFKQKNQPQATVETEWTQPTLSSNTTAVSEGNIVCSASVTYGSYSPYKALNRLTGSGNNWYGDATPSSSNPAWWQIKFPYFIKITGLTFNSGHYSSTPTKNARFYTDSSLSTPIGNAFSGSSSYETNTVISGIPSEGIITDTIYLNITSSYNNSVGMGELTITATKIVPGAKINDVWFDTSTKPYVSKIYNGSEWTEHNYVPLPQTVTVTGGTISSINKSCNFNDNGWDKFVTLPDLKKVTSLTSSTTYTASINGWISNGSYLVRPLLIGESFTPASGGYKFYAMKGV